MANQRSRPRRLEVKVLRRFPANEFVVTTDVPLKEAVDLIAAHRQVRSEGSTFTVRSRVRLWSTTQPRIEGAIIPADEGSQVMVRVSTHPALWIAPIAVLAYMTVADFSAIAVVAVPGMLLVKTLMLAADADHAKNVLREALHAARRATELSGAQDPRR